MGQPERWQGAPLPCAGESTGSRGGGLGGAWGSTSCPKRCWSAALARVTQSLLSPARGCLWQLAPAELCFSCPAAPCPTQAGGWVPGHAPALALGTGGSAEGGRGTGGPGGPGSPQPHSLQPAAAWALPHPLNIAEWPGCSWHQPCRACCHPGAQVCVAWATPARLRLPPPGGAWRRAASCSAAPQRRPQPPSCGGSRGAGGSGSGFPATPVPGAPSRRGGAALRPCPGAAGRGRGRSGRAPRGGARCRGGGRGARRRP